MSRAAILLGLLLASAASAAGDPMKDIQRLKGTWEVMSMMQNGGVRAESKGEKLVFTADRMTYFGRDGKRAFSFTLDPSQKPKALDFTCLDGTFKGKSGKGIYQLDGDDLKLCLPNKDAQDRPTEFTSTNGSNIVVFTLKRKKE